MSTFFLFNVIFKCGLVFENFEFLFIGRIEEENILKHIIIVTYATVV